MKRTATLIYPLEATATPSALGSAKRNRALRAVNQLEKARTRLGRRREQIGEGRKARHSFCTAITIFSHLLMPGAELWQSWFTYDRASSSLGGRTCLPRARQTPLHSHTWR